MSERLLRIPEVAKELGIAGEAVYGLIERGELQAGKGEDGLVYVPESTLAAFRAGASAPS